MAKNAVKAPVVKKTPAPKSTGKRDTSKMPPGLKKYWDSKK